MLGSLLYASSTLLKHLFFVFALYLDYYRFTYTDLLQIIHTLCASNDTMTLKGVCNSLSRKPSALDVVMLFTQSSHLLQPLCHVLDNWQEHEDQGVCLICAQLTAH